MKVAFITSLDRGIPLFLLNEIRYYMGHGVNGKVFFVMKRPGTYMPPPEWDKHYMDPLKTLLAQIPAFVRRPKLYLSLLLTAIKTRTLFEFMIAAEFAEKMRECDRIHAFFADHKLVIGYYCKKILGKKLSCSVYGYDVYIPKNKSLIKEIYRETDFVVATNLLFAALLQRDFGVPAEKIVLARTVVDVERYSNARKYQAAAAEVSRAIGAARDKFKILVVARLVYRKGVHVLLQAIAEMKDREKVVLWVVGDGAEREKLMELAGKLGLARNVVFFGSLSVENLLPLYQNCDLYCQPSITDPSGDKEGLPVAMTEAMAFEKPVIATSHADIPNVLQEILVPENDHNALASAIQKVMAMPAEERALLGMKNREIVVRKFSERNYERVLARFLRNT
ncbi:MAG: glycosyltransferase family 4 protein [Thermoplasmata archaeon]|nr:glycosyltransferase family 4 protein [Thermoplasmata archaeon]